MTTPAPIMRPCEGSNLVGHAYYAPTIGEVVMCQMCGGHFEAVVGHHDQVPLHDRADILAMIDRGDFNEAANEIDHLRQRIVKAAWTEPPRVPYSPDIIGRT